ncbi:Uncharacterized protein TPAR_01961, partial [Tolypocladium paradoxum]
VSITPTDGDDAHIPPASLPRPDAHRERSSPDHARVRRLHRRHSWPMRALHRIRTSRTTHPTAARTSWTNRSRHVHKFRHRGPQAHVKRNEASAVRQAAVAGRGGLGCGRGRAHCQARSRPGRPVAISRAKVLHDEAHYDARFMVEPLDEAPHRAAIRVLIQTYLATCRELGVQTWLMHGSLLGWWWGNKASLHHP